MDKERMKGKRQGRREGGKLEEKIAKILKIVSRVRARGLVKVLISGRCQGQSRTRARLPLPSAFCSCCGGIMLNIKLEMVKTQS